MAYKEFQESKLLSAYKKNANSLTEAQKNQLILDYTPLIKFVAQRISARLPGHIETNDLISSGVIGLMDALEKYDPSRDNKFKTYAEFRIRGSILDELRSQDWVPRSIRDKAKSLEKARTSLEAKLNRTPTAEELSQFLGISMDEYHTLVNKVHPASVFSIDNEPHFGDVDKRSLLNLLEDCKINNPFHFLETQNIKKIMVDAISALPERQKMVLSLYYYEDINLRKIGQLLKVTESRVSQLHAQAIKNLKSLIKSGMNKS